jgi:hypothetical protein
VIIVIHESQEDMCKCENDECAWNLDSDGCLFSWRISR